MPSGNYSTSVVALSMEMLSNNDEPVGRKPSTNGYYISQTSSY